MEKPLTSETFAINASTAKQQMEGIIQIFLMPVFIPKAENLAMYGVGELIM